MSAATGPQAGAATLELVLVAIGNLRCGIDLRCVQEIDRNLDITRVRHAPAYVRGVVNLRGQLLTVIDLRKKFDLDPVDTTSETRIVVVEQGDGAVGLLVDRVDDIIAASAQDMEPPPSNVGRVAGALFRAIYKMEDGLVAVLDLEEVLAK
jgi:purine-binding chemotaxis protein CheW